MLENYRAIAYLHIIALKLCSHILSHLIRELAGVDVGL